MPRNRIPATKREKHDEAVVKEAIRRVVEDHESFGEVALELNLPKTSVYRYVKQFRENPDRTMFTQQNYHTRIFTDQEELMLAEYIRRRCHICYGMSSADVRRLAFEFGEINRKNLPESWIENKEAGMYLSIIFFPV